MSSRTDQGAGEVARRLTQPGGAGAGISIEMYLGQLAKQAHRQEKLWELRRQLHTVPITAPPMLLAGGAGTINSPDLLGPHDGYEWDVRRLVAASFTAGTVTAYKNYQADENLVAVWTVPGTWSFSTALMLNDSDALLIVASGITGGVTISGEAVQVPAQLVPEYLI